MTQPTLAARIRQHSGKEAVRKLRKNNQLPAVFYGPGTAALPLTVSYPEFERLMKQPGSENLIFDLQLQSETGLESRQAMLKELQIDPIRNTFLHADFYEIAMDREITVDLAVHLVNTPVGVPRGGILQAVLREITVSCLPGKLVDALEVDVSGLDIGDSIHIRDLSLPEGIRPLEEGHLTVAVVAAPAAEPGEEAEEMLEEKAAAELGEGEISEDHRKGGE